MSCLAAGHYETSGAHPLHSSILRQTDEKEPDRTSMQTLNSPNGTASKRHGDRVTAVLNDWMYGERAASSPRMQGA